MSDPTTRTAPRSPLPATGTAVTLTVVIPHFNQSHILARAVASVLASDLRDFEIVIIDDGSTDGGAPVLAALEGAHPSIRIIRYPKNRGTPVALNAGLAAARGRYVSFLGADDFVLPDFHKTMIAALERNAAAALACGEIATVGEDGSIRGIRPFTVPAFRQRYLTPEEVRRRIAHTDNWVSNTAVVYRTALIRAVGGFDASLGAFCDGFASRLLAFAHGFVFVPGVYGAWQVAAKSLSASTILDPEMSARMVALAQERLAESPIGHVAPKYPELFARRLRFGAARLHFVWKGADADPDQIAEVTGGEERDRRLLRGIRRNLGFGPCGRMLALAWLAARLRPIGPGSLIVHYLRNRLMLLRHRRHIRDSLRTLDDAGTALTRGVPTATQSSDDRRHALK